MILGPGSDLSTAVQVACESSLRKPSLSYYVKDLSGLTGVRYLVLNGVARKL